MRRPLAESLHTLRRNRLRTFFMMFGLLAGIASLTVLESIGEATRRETMRRFRNMIGTFDTVIVRPGAPRMRGMPTLANVPPTLTFDDAAAVAGLPSIQAVAQAQTAFDIDVKYRERIASPLVFGVSANWLKLRSDEVGAGSFFTEEQARSLARVAVLGSDVRTSLFPGEDPLGRTIRIAGVPFEVVGVMRPRGAGPAGGSLDNVILMPVTTASRRLFNRDYLTMMIAQLKDPAESDGTATRIAALLHGRHRIAAGLEDDFTVTNPRAVMARVTRAGSTLSRILIGVAAGSLLAGAIVIASLMSLGVTARRREIGMRRAAGATRNDILLQFLLECLLVALGGGMAGALLGVAGMEVATRIQHLPPLLLWRPLAVDAALSIGVGIVSGLYPAWSAARLDPIEALRS